MLKHCTIFKSDMYFAAYKLKELALFCVLNVALQIPFSFFFFPTDELILKNTGFLF